ncbi:glycosyltransferase family 2 protein [Echinimonas agarilytica]|uniref:Glycosyltransferase n=1 Tax=Echinimonas agarilytica TaxID=1215918 RepID=A0AA41W671_9GAMM|nr:glycosyltransferase family 2 protein [Echinimonas agarilytica]MCM2679535.1 glycosyltransferase [Echinimonas agarilytica]
MKSKSPLVSVIVPVYNAEKWIDECLSSLLNQSMIQLEVILVLDAPTDSSVEHVARFCQRDPQRFRMIELASNMGVSAARNIGMKAAKGQYIGFVDSDDWVQPNMFESMYLAAVEKESDIVSCQIKTFELCQSGWVFKAMPLHAQYENTFVTNKLFRRAFLIAEGICFYTNVIFEDEPFVYTARFSGQNYVELEQHFYNYRMNPEGQCRNANKSRFNLYDKELMLARFMADIESRGNLDEHSSEMMECLANHALSALYYDITLIDLVGYFRFIDHLVTRHRLVERKGFDDNDYRISRFLRFRRKPLLIAALALWARGKYRWERLSLSFKPQKPVEVIA